MAIISNDQQSLTRQRMMIVVSWLEASMDAVGGVEDRRFEEAFVRGAFSSSNPSKFYICFDLRLQLELNIY